MRTCLPDRLERRPAPRARVFQPRGTDRTDEVRRLDRTATDWTLQPALRQLRLHGADLELSLADVLEILGRPKEEVDDRSEKRRHQPEQRRHRDQPRVVDSAAGVLV